VTEVEQAATATDPAVIAALVATALVPIDEAYGAWGGEPEDWLYEPSFAANREVLEAAASNPHLSRATALELAFYLPDRIVHHPAFDVGAAEDHVVDRVLGYLDEAQIRRIFDSSAAVRELVRDHEPPLLDLLVELAMAGDEVAISRVNTLIDQVAPELLISLCEHPRWAAFDAAGALRRRAAGAHPPSLAQLTALSDEWDRIQIAHALAANPHTDPRDLERLLADLETEHIAAENPSAPADFVALMKHAHSLFYEASEIAAGNEDEPWMGIPDLGASQIARLEAAGPLAREAAARLPQRSVEDLGRLSRSEDVWVRQGVAQNPAAPRIILELLAVDVEEDVRELVAANPAWHETPA
jgi:hypothetical protein